MQLRQDSFCKCDDRFVSALGEEVLRARVRARVKWAVEVSLEEMPPFMLQNDMSRNIEYRADV